MKVGIFGGTGFIGKELITFLSRDFELISFTRNDLSLDSHLLASKMEGLDILINLIGAPVIARPWTRKYKKLILLSRVDSLTKIYEALKLTKNRPSQFLSASAIGIYKPGLYSDENSKDFAHDFIASVVQSWETSAFKIKELVNEVLILRFGIVLKKEGATLREMTKLYNKKVAVIMGPVDYDFPFISMNDLLRAVEFLIQNKAKTNIYNFTTPVRTSNLQFCLAMKAVFPTRIYLRIPSSLLRIIMGGRANVIIAGQHVYPKNLLELGFIFRDSDIADFLKREFNKN
jgi:uncharacterized protein